MTKTKHRNSENVVKCPVEGCDHEGLSRGMHLHIRQSSGSGHGPHGDVPEHLDLDNLEVVGQKDVEMNYPDKRNVEDVARLCPYCGRAFNGYQGVKIHVGQKQGQGVHPEDATDIEKSDCPVAHVDEDMNVIEVVEENSLMPSTKRRLLNETSSVNYGKVQDFVEELRSDGEDEFADRVEDALL